MRPGVRARLVEADSGSEAESIGSELDAYHDRIRVTRVDTAWCGTGSPDRAGAVHVDSRAWSRCLQVAAVINRPRLDGRRRVAMGHPGITPGHRGIRGRYRRRRMPGRTAVRRDLYADDHAAARVSRGTGDGDGRTVRDSGSR